MKMLVVAMENDDVLFVKCFLLLSFRFEGGRGRREKEGESTGRRERERKH